MKGHTLPELTAAEYEQRINMLHPRLQNCVGRIILWDVFGGYTTTQTTPELRAMWDKYDTYDKTVIDDEDVIAALIIIGCKPDDARTRVRGENWDTPKDNYHSTGERMQKRSRRRNCEGKRIESDYDTNIEPYQVSPDIGYKAVSW